jgi:putative DNA-invertase from lambdoid prophage Rac
MQTVLYCRVSTLDQTLDHQRTQAEAAGFRIDNVVADHGVSGVHTALRDRPEGKCESAWNKDPVFGVIGIQSGPRG